MADLHGVETIELTSGTVAVTTIQTAIIGLVGTAPDASAGTRASGTTGTPILDNVLSFNATTIGRAENAISVEAVAASPDLQTNTAIPTSAVWHAGAKTLSITLGCDEKGAGTATPSDVVAAIKQIDKDNTDEDGIIKNSVRVQALGSGGGIVTPFNIQLSGGEDEPFPLNTPVAIVGTTMLSRLGVAGTLAEALSEINDQRNALTVVVRVAEEADATEQRAAVLAGIKKLSSSKSVNSYQPRIVIAPGFSEDDAVGKGLETVAGKLRAVAYVDCKSGATLQEVVQRRQSYGARVELLRPRVQVSNANGQLVYRPYSAFAAGLRARIDFEKGWWWSKSNQDINNILGVEQIDEFILGDRNCDANLLNMQNVSTIVRRSGFKHWGNRLCADDPQWHFESVRRTADVIEDSIQEAMLPYVDRPLDRENADDIIGTINSYMRKLVGLKAIFGGRAWLDEELNTAETLAAGELYINYDFGPKSPTELISLRVRVNNNYALEEMLAA
ncbi:phage tail sheath C-terminal domain-containing protein [Pantoea anthophila]|uniref:phage tail sheath C-terminal domain-containing protein n=1 Tax=Pantoea anthophila TaxID=470931 RepID=UPI00301C457C